MGFLDDCSCERLLHWNMWGGETFWKWEGPHTAVKMYHTYTKLQKDICTCWWSPSGPHWHQHLGGCHRVFASCPLSLFGLHYVQHSSENNYSTLNPPPPQLSQKQTPSVCGRQRGNSVGSVASTKCFDSSWAARSSYLTDGRCCREFHMYFISHAFQSYSTSTCQL